ncbi:MAG: Gfo/Idh/MocA family oxidoreductase, partial [Clostridiales bacterium]|nr:Gfo/Idh/MocA family oxidoreductase [Clostridiales bacterium]
SSDKEFFARGKRADLCIIATQDAQHKGHALAALEAGYDLLLEKPLAVRWEDCRAVYDAARALKRRVFICHVLRYAPFFRLIKNELDTGAYGRVAAVNLTENVCYWHQAHAYVRGNWRDGETASPMIIAKCCHDLDILSHLIGAPCKAVSSMGSLGFFTAANAPAKSSDKCLTCGARAECPYDAERIYLTDRFEKGLTGWPVDVLGENLTREALLDALKTGPYGRCVFRCDNNVVDRQIVNMDFEDGAAAHLTMTAFSEDCYREIHVHGEKGEIFGNMRDNALTCNIFGKGSKTLNVKDFEEGVYGHGGGDYFMIKDVAAAYCGGGEGLTSIENSMQSHAIGFAAEESRKNGGALTPVPKLSEKA